MRVLFATGVSLAGAAIVAGGILFAVHRSATGSGVDGPPIVYVSIFSNTGSNLLSVQPGSPPKQLTHQGSSFVFSPVCSPDGKSIVYLNVPGADVPLKAGTSSVAALTVLDTATGAQHVLDDRASALPAGELLQSPLWTNNGALIVFETQDFIASAIKPDGTARQDHELGCFSPALSTDGTLATCVAPDAYDDQVWLLPGPEAAPPNGNPARRQLSTSPAASGARFSHDGRWLAWSGIAATDGHTHVFVVALEPKSPLSGDLRPTDHRARLRPEVVTDRRPVDIFNGTVALDVAHDR